MNGRTVVVIEDDDNIAELLELCLGQAGYRVARSVTGEEGQAPVRSHCPALAIVDIGLPGGIDGLEVCGRLRAANHLPVLMLTARGEKTDRWDWPSCSS